MSSDEDDERARVADVDAAVDGRAAGVDADPARVARLERPQLAACACRAGGSRASRRAASTPARQRSRARRDRQRGDALAAADEAHPLAGRRLDVDALGGEPERAGERARASRRGAAPSFGRSMHDASRRRCTTRQAALARRSATTSRSSSSESASRQRSSVSGKCSPMSPSPAAPSSASITAWVSTSASEWPVEPALAAAISTPPRISAPARARGGGVVADAGARRSCADARSDRRRRRSRRSNTHELAHAERRRAARAPAS